ncbi:MAG TPA: NUDIX hydrolase [Gaiellaceae bacterium]|nr:NUDIX hydrolase [Gaiellaceae bacterium]
MHLSDQALAPIRERYGTPSVLEWAGEISRREYEVATYDPRRVHDITLFILNGPRLALIRKPAFPPGVWRPPGGGVKPDEDVVEGIGREAYEETGLRVELRRYLVETRARFSHGDRELDWRTHVFLATTADDELEPHDTDEIAGARWGTLEELGGPLRERLLATGRAFWRYRVALHDAALAALRTA